MNTTEYRRLPGSGAGILQRRSLWLGADHILSVRMLPFAQEYRRFYLRDVQALVLAETGAGAAYYIHATAAFMALLCVLLAYTFHFVYAGMAGALAVGLFRIGIGQPNCICYLKTAASSERLRSLGRISKARKAIAILQPAIDAAQAGLAKP